MLNEKRSIITIINLLSRVYALNFLYKILAICMNYGVIST